MILPTLLQGDFTKDDAHQQIAFEEVVRLAQVIDQELGGDSGCHHGFLQYGSRQRSQGIDGIVRLGLDVHGNPQSFGKVFQDYRFSRGHEPIKGIDRTR